jgi:exodeoxyribonuclease-1
MDWPLQFAGVRTDENLNIIEDPIDIYCKLPEDHLPHPAATVITKITPEQANSKGFIEPKFAGIIHKHMSEEHTCTVGYNNLRFDDEVTRHMFFRNFYDPYKREYANGNSKWDLIDLVRATAVLRPDDIEWPLHQQGDLAGCKSFKLEDLVKANGFANANAHNALADVYATIDLAKLLYNKKRKLFDYFLNLRDKGYANNLLQKYDKLVHVSSKYGSLRQYCSVIHPLGPHPQYKNEVIILDLTKDPKPIFELSATELATIIFTKKNELPEGTPELGIRTIKLNQCPFIATTKILSEADNHRLQLDFSQIEQNLQQINNNKQELYNKIKQIYESPAKRITRDVEQSLYTGGFLGWEDAKKIAEIPLTSSEKLAKQTITFKDNRLPELLFRYLARNYPNDLLDKDKKKWHEYRKIRLSSNLTEHKILGFNDFKTLWQEQWQKSANNTAEQQLLTELKDYAEKLEKELIYTTSVDGV